jgi:predicted Mrr-cat superfamily restriction endonuclease
MRFWQVGTGDAGRDFSQLCLDHDVVCIGPGKFGPYDEEKYDAAIVRNHYSRSKILTIRSFRNDVQLGDIVILRNRQTVVGVGIVGSDYGHDNRFDDIFGWDLEHFRRVVWQHQLNEELGKIQENHKLFGHMKQQPTFSAVTNNNGDVLDRIRPLVAEFKERPLSEMPPPPVRTT